jgi:GT2 family glycosyltransferase
MAHAERARRLPSEVYADWVTEFDTLTDSDLEGMHALDEALEQRPFVSVLMTVVDPREGHLRSAIESVRAQVYADWELCVADMSTNPHIRRMLEKYERLDGRVRVARHATDDSVSGASNAALALARGELIAVLAHDDLLRPHSLLLSMLPFQAGRGVGFVYSDEDLVDDDGERIGHDFKPDWSPALLLCQSYACSLAIIRTDLVRAVGGFHSRYDEAQCWDLALRVTEGLSPEGVAHIPHILCHRRVRPGSDSSHAPRRAVEEHLERTGRRGKVLPVGEDQKVRFLLCSPRPRVSVIVPSTGRRELLAPCVEGVLSRTAYEELELVVAVDQADYEDPSNRDFLSQLALRPRVRLHRYPARPFNYALTVNEAVTTTDAPLVLLLNDDIEVVSEDWLEAMVGYAEEDRVGAVGGLLVYPDGTIHSAGMLVGARSVAENRYHRRPADVAGYANRARLPQDLEAVVGTCMLVRREAFEEVGGLDVSFPVAYNDVDFCLRLRRAGWRILYVPDAVLVHHGSASFGTHQSGRDSEHEADLERMVGRWRETLRDDPTHNPNLSLDASHPDELAFPPRVSYPWRGHMSSLTAVPGG